MRPYYSIPRKSQPCSPHPSEIVLLSLPIYSHNWTRIFKVALSRSLVLFLSCLRFIRSTPSRSRWDSNSFLAYWSLDIRSLKHPSGSGSYQVVVIAFNKWDFWCVPQPLSVIESKRYMSRKHKLPQRVTYTDVKCGHFYLYPLACGLINSSQWGDNVIQRSLTECIIPILKNSITSW